MQKKPRLPNEPCLVAPRTGPVAGPVTGGALRSGGALASGGALHSGGGFLGAIGSAASGLVGDIVGEVAKPVVDMVGDIVSPVVDGAADAIPNVTGAFTDVIPQLTQGIINMLPGQQQAPQYPQYPTYPSVPTYPAPGPAVQPVAPQFPGQAQQPQPAPAGDSFGRDIYQRLLDMTPAEWERIREGAHQLLGGSASPMWGRMHLEAPPGGGKRTLHDIARLSHASDAARAVELEGVAGGDIARGIGYLHERMPRMR